MALVPKQPPHPLEDAGFQKGVVFPSGAGGQSLLVVP